MSFKTIEKVARLQSKVFTESDQGRSAIQEKLLKKIESNKKNLSLAKVVRVASQCSLELNSKLKKMIVEELNQGG